MTDQPENKPVAQELSGRIGKYEIVHHIGKGAMGLVYRARQLNVAREVAIKVLRPDVDVTDEIRQRSAAKRYAPPGVWTP